MTLRINGIDITPYIAFNGLKWQRSDVDGPNAGRSMAGTMIRDRIAIKKRLDVTLIPLPTDTARMILGLIRPEFVTVTYDDIMDGVVTKQMYSNNIPAQFLIKRKDGTELWSGITFPLIEK